MNTALSDTTSLRLWSKVDQSAGPDGCWLWQGYCNRSGHGRIRFNGRLALVHRVVFEAANGPTELYVLHRCDVPACVNPAHLWSGTVQDNNRDRDEKGRNVNKRGSQHGMARLDEEKVIRIRELHDQGHSVAALAKTYKVARGTVRFVVDRATWTHV